MDSHQHQDLERRDWEAKLSLAEMLIPVIGTLYRDRGVVVSLFGRTLINRSPIDIVKEHRFSRHIHGEEQPLAVTSELLEIVQRLQIRSTQVDVGELVVGWRDSGSGLEEYLAETLTPQTEQAPEGAFQQRDVVLYGFGRIGRLLARILISQAGAAGDLRLRAIVVRRNGPDDMIKRASLLRRDSVHGLFDGTITVDTVNERIIANGCSIQVIYANDPATIDYQQFGIDNAIIVDNTGQWRDRAGLEKHLESAGAETVLLTAPGKGDIKNIVFGINHDEIEQSDRILSAASCTTNAVAPVLAALERRYGVVHGHIETVHSFTNDQNLIDNFHRGSRRGRAATLNMVIAETGAAKAVAKAVPSLNGKLTGSAIRVPTPDVSIAVLNLQLGAEETKEGMNTFIRELSLTSDLRRQVGYIHSPEVVSTDFLGSRQAGIVDGLATQCDGRNAVLYVWYDNEYGYARQVIRILKELAARRRAPRAVLESSPV